jgi:flagellar basal body P-ring formation protein FlgA
MKSRLALRILVAGLAWAGAGRIAAASLSGLALREEAQVDREGVFLAQIATAPDGSRLPPIRLLEAPAPGTPVVLPRARLLALLAEAGVVLAPANCAGADAVRVSRRTRQLDEAEFRDRLVAALQAGRPGDAGEFEARLPHSWRPVPVPDEPLEVRFVDPLPPRLNSRQVVRVELLSGSESVGAWSLLLQLRLWREVWVTRATLRRGDALDDASVARERRDVLACNETLAELPADLRALEMAEFVPANTPLSPRHLRLRPVVRRGQNADAVLEDGPLQLVLRVEVLEDGAPGQTIRLRNSLSRRELRGIVQNEKTIRICL